MATQIKACVIPLDDFKIGCWGNVGGDIGWTVEDEDEVGEGMETVAYEEEGVFSGVGGFEVDVGY